MAFSGTTSNPSMRYIIEKEKLSGTNFLDWSRNLRIVLRQEIRKLYVLDEEVPDEEPPASAPMIQKDAYQKHLNDSIDVTCLMLASITSELQKQFEEKEAFMMMGQLKAMFQEQARQERFNTIKTFINCKLARGSQVSPHVLKMKSYLEQLQRLGLEITRELTIDHLVLQSLPNNFDQFVLNYNMHDMEKTLTGLHGMLKTAKQNIKSGPDVIMVQNKKNPKKRENQEKGKGRAKAPMVDANSTPKPNLKVKKDKDGQQCFFCHLNDHWKRNCKLYLEDLNKKKGIVRLPLQGLRGSRTLVKGEVDLRVENGARVAVLVVETYDLNLPSGLLLELNNCYYVPAISRNIIYISCLDLDGFRFVIQE